VRIGLHRRGGDRRRIEIAAGGLLPLELRETEVEDLHPPIGGEEDVLRLEIAMDDPFRVRGGEAVCDLRGDVDRLPPRHRSLHDPPPQRFTFEELGDAVRRLVGGAVVVDGEDVRMGEGRDRLRLALEAHPGLAVADEALRQHFHRDVTVETAVASPVDVAHSPRADRVNDLVRSEAGTGGQRHGSGNCICGTFACR
jgi:hypothetical protein